MGIVVGFYEISNICDFDGALEDIWILQLVLHKYLKLEHLWVVLSGI